MVFDDEDERGKEKFTERIITRVLKMKVGKKSSDPLKGSSKMKAGKRSSLN